MGSGASKGTSTAQVRKDPESLYKEKQGRPSVGQTGEQDKPVVEIQLSRRPNQHQKVKRQQSGQPTVQERSYSYSQPYKVRQSQQPPDHQWQAGELQQQRQTGQQSYQPFQLQQPQHPQWQAGKPPHEQWSQEQPRNVQWHAGQTDQQSNHAWQIEQPQLQTGQQTNRPLQFGHPMNPQLQSGQQTNQPLQFGYPMNPQLQSGQQTIQPLQFGHPMNPQSQSGQQTNQPLQFGHPMNPQFQSGQQTNQPLQFGHPMNPHLQTGQQTNQPLQFGHPMNPQLQSGQQTNQPLQFGHPMNPQLQSGQQTIQPLGFGHPMNQQLQSGQQTIQPLEFGHPMNPQLQSGQQTIQPLEFGHPMNPQLQTGQQTNQPLQTGHPPNPQLQTGQQTNQPLQTEHPLNPQLQTGQQSNQPLQMGQPLSPQLQAGQLWQIQQQTNRARKLIQPPQLAQEPIQMLQEQAEAKTEKPLDVFLDVTKNVEKVVKCQTFDAKQYLLRHVRQDIESFGVQVADEEDNLCFYISGQEKLIQNAEDLLIEHSKSIKTEHVEFEQPGLMKFSESGELDKQVKKIEDRQKCFIRVDKHFPSMKSTVRASSGSVMATSSASAAATSTILVTPQGHKITWNPGDITKEQVHSLVIPQGTCFERIREHFSPATCQAIDEMKFGEITVSSGVSMSCMYVIHSCCSFWDGSGGTAERNLRTIVYRSLLECGRLGGSSIAFPVIGSGNLRFPRSEACRIMLDEAIQFCRKHPHSIVKDIRFVIFMEDKNLLDAFQREASKIQNQGTNFAQGDISVEVIKGNLTHEDTDAIVNIMDRGMNMQNAGQLSKAIAKASGKEVQEECNRLGMQSGGAAVMTSAGNLRVSHIIHIVPGSSDKVHLQQCLESALRLADASKLRSISIPSIGTGYYKMSAVDSAQLTFKALRNLRGSLTSVSKVRVVVYQAEMMGAFQQEKQMYSMPSYKGGPSSAIARGVFSVDVVKGDLTQEDTDVIVNIMNKRMDMQNSGQLSKAIANASGKKVQEECNRLGMQSGGAAVMTSAGNLKVSHIIHIVPGSSDKVHLQQCLENALRLADARNLRSISIPSIGTGYYKISAVDSAQVTFQALKNLSGKLTSVSKVRVVVYQAEMMGAFQQEKQMYSMTSYKDVLSSSMESRVFNIDVINGDLTKEATAAIVNINSKTMNMSSAGKLSKAIANACGPTVQEECDRLGSQPSGSAVMTSGGKMKVPHIIHIVPGSSEKGHLQQCLQNALRVADQNKLPSISIPAIGTGNYRLSPSESSKVVFEALKNFRQTCVNISEVRVVVYQGDMMQAFQQEKAILDKEYVSYDSPHISTVLSQSSKTTVKVWVTSNNTVSVNKAVANLKKAFSKSCITKEIFNEDIRYLSQRQANILFREAFIRDIQIELDPTTNRARLRGCPGNMPDMVSKITAEINNSVEKRRKENDYAEAFSKLVEWSYETHGNKTNFDMQTNAELELAWTRNKTTVQISLNGEDFIVNIRARTGQFRRSNEQVKIQRTSKEGVAEIGIPSHWEPMPLETNVLSVTLAPGSPEYQDVQRKFQATLRDVKIIKIERIQNAILYQTYMLRKQKMDRDNGRNSELQLFHATRGQTICRQINELGFNRSFCGKNGVYYGRGVYFAKDASYSRSYTGRNGQGYMYLARVLVGLFCKGHSEMITPPPRNKSGDPTKLFDSVVDNESNPGQYVVFFDDRCYPEYLIFF